MLTLDRVKQSNKAITRGTKLFCYVDSYGFRKGYRYHVHNIIDGDIIVKDRDSIEVIFCSVAELKNIFMITED